MIKTKYLKSSKVTNISKMKTIKIKEKTHYYLNLFRVKNRFKSLDEAINKLLKK